MPRIDNTGLKMNPFPFVKHIVFLQKLHKALSDKDIEAAISLLIEQRYLVMQVKDSIFDYIYSEHINSKFQRVSFLTDHDLSKLLVTICEKAFLLKEKIYSDVEKIAHLNKVISEIEYIIPFLNILNKCMVNPKSKVTSIELRATLQNNANISFEFESFDSYTEAIAVRTMVINAIKAQASCIKIIKKVSGHLNTYTIAENSLLNRWHESTRNKFFTSYKLGYENPGIIKEENTRGGISAAYLAGQEQRVSGSSQSFLELIDSEDDPLNTTLAEGEAAFKSIKITFNPKFENLLAQLSD